MNPMNHTWRIAAVTLGLALGAGAALADNGEIDLTRAPTVAAPDAPPLDRAEVVADLNLWRRAGLADSAEVDVQSPAYQAKLATYQQWRSSPAFAAEVERVREGRNPTAHATAPVQRDTQ